MKSVLSWTELFNRISCQSKRNWIFFFIIETELKWILFLIEINIFFNQNATFSLKNVDFFKNVLSNEMWQSDPECEFSFPALRRIHKNWWIITLQNSLFHINIWIEIPNSITSVRIFLEPFFLFPTAVQYELTDIVENGK